MHRDGEAERAEAWPGRTASTPAHRALPKCLCFHYVPPSCNIVWATVVFLLTFLKAKYHMPKGNTASGIH